MKNRASTDRAKRLRKAEQRLIRVAWTLGNIFAATGVDYRGNNGLIGKLVRAAKFYQASK